MWRVGRRFMAVWRLAARVLGRVASWTAVRRLRPGTWAVMDGRRVYIEAVEHGIALVKQGAGDCSGVWVALRRLRPFP